MGRLIFTIVGIFLFLGSLFVIWLTSAPGQRLLVGAGLDKPDLTPQDVSLAFGVLFISGFVLLGGSVLESFASTVTRTLTGGGITKDEAMNRGQEGLGLPKKLLWGGSAYLFVSIAFGSYLILFVMPPGQTLARFTDPQFLSFILRWPYMFISAMGLFGLPPEAFN